MTTEGDGRMCWTDFWDMHSGGSAKEAPYENIFIEAPATEARTIFYNRFGHSPSRVTCTCCGEDYSVDESPTLEEATAFHRKGQPLEEYVIRDDVLVVAASEVTAEEREGVVPAAGYVWVGQ